MDDSTNVEAFAAAAAPFRALADPTRLRVVAFLRAGEACVCEVQRALDVPPNLLSHHLKVLREAGIVIATRRGRWIDYRLDVAALADLATWLHPVGAPPAAARRGPSCHAVAGAASP